MEHSMSDIGFEIDDLGQGNLGKGIWDRVFGTGDLGQGIWDRRFVTRDL